MFTAKKKKSVWPNLLRTNLLYSSLNEEKYIQKHLQNKLDCKKQILNVRIYKNTAAVKGLRLSLSSAGLSLNSKELHF